MKQAMEWTVYLIGGNYADVIYRKSFSSVEDAREYGIAVQKLIPGKNLIINIVPDKWKGV